MKHFFNIFGRAKPPQTPAPTIENKIDEAQPARDTIISPPPQNAFITGTMPPAILNGEPTDDELAGLESSEEFRQWQAGKTQRQRTNLRAQMEADKIRAQLRRDNAEERQRMLEREAQRAAAKIEADKQAAIERAKPRNWESVYRHLEHAGTMFQISAGGAQMIVEKSGLKSFVAAKAREAQPHLERYNRFSAERRAIGPNAAKELFRASLAAGYQSARDGKNSPSPTIPNVELLEREHANQRLMLREKMRAEVEQIKPIAAALAAKLQAAARELAVKVHREEELVAAQWGAIHEPSGILKGLVNCGFHLAELGSQVFDPNEACWGLLSDTQKTT